jgi:hypothetical protein
VREFPLPVGETTTGSANSNIGGTSNLNISSGGVSITPHLSYVNELYVYPETVNFNNYHNGSVSCRNIALEFKLLDNDYNVQQEGLKVSPLDVLL